MQKGTLKCNQYVYILDTRYGVLTGTINQQELRTHKANGNSKYLMYIEVHDQPFNVVCDEYGHLIIGSDSSPIQSVSNQQFKNGEPVPPIIPIYHKGDVVLAMINGSWIPAIYCEQLLDSSVHRLIVKYLCDFNTEPDIDEDYECVYVGKHLLRPLTDLTDLLSNL